MTSEQSAGKPTRSGIDLLAVWIAEGFWVGKIPWGPGTFGSLFGFALFTALSTALSFWVLAAVVVLFLPLAIWSTGRAEIVLGKHDPASVVMDEIVAVPICFAPWWISNLVNGQMIGSWLAYFSVANLPRLGVLFLLFRVFDIWKPWPIGRLQKLPGGWGVCVDDLMAGCYTAAVWAALFLRHP